MEGGKLGRKGRKDLIFKMKDMKLNGVYSAMMI